MSVLTNGHKKSADPPYSDRPATASILLWKSLRQMTQLQCRTVMLIFSLMRSQFVRGLSTIYIMCTNEKHTDFRGLASKTGAKMRKIIQTTKFFGKKMNIL